MSEVITLGEPMVVFMSEELGCLKDVSKFTKGLAGAELNVSMGLSRLGHSITYVTQLGLDPFGEYIFDCMLKEENINMDYVSKTPKYLTGFYMKSKVLEGNPDIFYYRKHSAASYIGIETVKQIDLNSFKHLHITGITPALSQNCLEAVLFLAKQARERKISISFDPNLRQQLWSSKEEMIETINYIASLSNYIMPNIHEGEILTGKNQPEEIADFFLQKGVKNVIVKLGKEGSLLKNNHETKYIPGFVVDHVVDTVGAGDAFAAGVISGILKGMRLDDAVVIGNAMGAMAVMHKGDNEGLPTSEELTTFMSSK